MGAEFMSILIFIVVTLLADFFLNNDSGPFCIVIGLGSAIWFCLTRDKWEAIIDGVREGIHGSPNVNNETDELKTEDKKDE